MSIFKRIFTKILRLSAILSLALIPSCANVSIADSFASLMEPTSDGNPNRLFEIKGFATNAENALTGTYTANLEYTLATDGTNYYCSVGYGTATVTDIVLPTSYVDADGQSYIVTSIANNGFNNKGITSFDWNSITTLTSIGKQAFANNASLTTMQIPTGPTAIYPGTFENCVGLVNFSFNANVTRIWDHAFAGCNKLSMNYDASQSFTFPETLVEIDASAFANCYALTRLLFPSSLVTIEENAFYLCSGVTFIHIPTGVTNVSKYAFRGVSSARAYFAADAIPSTFETDWNRIGNKSGDTTNSSIYIQTITGVGSIDRSGDYIYSIKTDDTASIVEYVGDGDGNTTVVAIPDTLGGKTVTEVYERAFYDNKAKTTITSLTTNASLVTIGKNAFSGMTGITSLKLNEGLVTIGESAFSSDSGITTLTIPSTVTTISASAFVHLNYCTDLTFAGASDGTASLTYIGDSAFFNMGASLGTLTTAKELVLPASLGTNSSDGNVFGYYVFMNAKFFTTLTFKNHVNATTAAASKAVIRLQDFNNCTNLNKINWGNWVNEVGKEVFSNCTRLPYLYFPSRVNKINSNVSNNSYLSIYVANAYSSFATNAINGSIAGNNGAYINSGTDWNRISSFTALVNGIFYGIGDESNIYKDATNGIYYVVDDDAYRIDTHEPTGTHITVTGYVKTDAILGNTAVAAVKAERAYTIGTGEDALTYTVTEVGQGAFSGCKTATSFTLPNSITFFGKSSFYAAKYATEITGFTNTTSNTQYVFPTGLTYIADNALFYTGLVRMVISKAVDAYITTNYSEAPTVDKIEQSNNSNRLLVFGFNYACEGYALITCTSGIVYTGTIDYTNTVEGTKLVSNGGNLYYNSTTNYLLFAVHFGNGTALKTVAGCLSIGMDSCKNPDVLTSIDFNAGLTTIYSYAFNTDSKVTSLVMPTSMIRIGDNAFDGCSSIATITYRSSNTVDPTSDDGLSASILSFANLAGDAGNIEFIGAAAFSNCKKITGFILPANTSGLTIQGNALRTYNSSTVIYVRETYSDFYALHINNTTDSTKNWDATWSRVTDQVNNPAYYSSTQPTATELAARKYWRYVSNQPTLWTAA